MRSPALELRRHLEVLSRSLFGILAGIALAACGSVAAVPQSAPVATLAVAAPSPTATPSVRAAASPTAVPTASPTPAVPTATATVLLAPTSTTVPVVPTSAPAESQQSVAAPAGVTPDRPFGARTRDSGCQAHDALPDNACTPGAIFPDATAAEICRPGYSSSVRSVPPEVSRQVYREYGIVERTSRRV